MYVTNNLFDRNDIVCCSNYGKLINNTIIWNEITVDTICLRTIDTYSNKINYYKSTVFNSP